MKSIEISSFLKKIKCSSNAFILNERYYCEINGSWSKSKSEQNAKSRIYSTINVIIFDYYHFSKINGYIMYANDTDINLKSLTLFIGKKNQIQSAVNIITIKTIKKAVLLTDFIKLIDFKPVNKVKSAIDSLDLSIVNFESNAVPGLNAHIEYTIQGSFYYEVLNMNKFQDAEIIPLDSSERKDVIYCKLTEKNMKKIANKINKSLHKYFGKNK